MTSQMQQDRSLQGIPSPISMDAGIGMSVMPKSGSCTDIGLVREHNEDSIYSGGGLYIVCDGMGGHEAGEVASDIAVKTIVQYASKHFDPDALGAAVERANEAIIKAARQGLGREGMGTTCTALMVDGLRFAIAQVGDSRAYLLHNGMLQQTTRDHSLVADLVDSGEIRPEEARNHPLRSYITRALGLDPSIRPDLYELNAEEGDRLLLCSDGLYSMISDMEIEQILLQYANPQQAANALMQAALSAGGADNISVLVIDLANDSESHVRAISRRAKVTAAIVIGLLIAAIAAFFIVSGLAMANSAYIGQMDGKVAIFKGEPSADANGTAELIELTDISVSDLQPGTARRIETEGIRCESVDAAKTLVDSYRRNSSRSSTIQNSEEPPQGQATAANQENQAAEE